MCDLIRIIKKVKLSENRWWCVALSLVYFVIPVPDPPTVERLFGGEDAVGERVNCG